MEKELREEIVAFGRKVYEQGLVSGASGNLSARVDQDHILITPSACHKGSLVPGDLLLYDMTSSKATGGSGGRPSSETRMHTHVYRQRPEVQAVIHAHPPYTVALSVAGVSLAEVVLPETVIALKAIADCGYATPTTQDVVQVMDHPVREGHLALILARHGSVTLGKTLQEAFCHLETVENTARIIAIARSMGKVTALPQKEIDKLLVLSL